MKVQHFLRILSQFFQGNFQRILLGCDVNANLLVSKEFKKYYYEDDIFRLLLQFSVLKIGNLQGKKFFMTRLCKNLPFFHCKITSSCSFLHLHHVTYSIWQREIESQYFLSISPFWAGVLLHLTISLFRNNWSCKIFIYNHRYCL